MLKDTIRPTIEDNAEAIAQALDGVTANEFVATYLKNLSEILIGNPRQYRAYGPWWWAIKDLMVKNGNTDFGTTVDMAVLAIYGNDNPTNTIISSFNYFNEVMNEGRIYSAEHLLPLPDGDVYIYELEDMEVECYVM